MIKRNTIRDTIIKSNGKFFSVVFVKRTTGEIRQMTARLGVKSYLKGGVLSYDAKSLGLITAFDVAKKDYRSIPIENILKFNGQEVVD